MLTFLNPQWHLRALRANRMISMTMNKNLVRPAMAAVLAIAFGGSAFAVETIDLPAGKSFTTKIGTWNSSNCEAGPYPRMEFKQPANGKFSSKKGRSVEPAGSACAGKNLPGWIITYTPKKGFRGKDCGSITLNFQEYVNGGNEISQNYPICFNVK
jgi:hypothetical protein